MRTHHPRRRAEPLATQLLAERDGAGAPLPLPLLFPPSTPQQEELHSAIYHLIALALRAYMQTWYGKISPRDEMLLPTVNRDIVVPLLHPILSRLVTEEGREPLADLILLHVPTILATHVQVYWESRADLFSTLPAGYHARLPTVTTAEVDGQYALNPAYTTALVIAFLTQYLPQKDYDAVAERLIVREVVARAVLGSVGKRLSAAWFYAEMILKHTQQPGTKPAPHTSLLGKLRKGYHSLIAGMSLLWGLITWLIAFLCSSPPPKDKYVRLVDAPLALTRALLGIDGRNGLAPPPRLAAIALMFLQVVLTLLSPIIDRVIPYLVTQQLTAHNGLKVVALIERILFPDGWPGPSPIEPTEEETARLDQDARVRLAEILPSFILAGITPIPGDTPADALVDVIADNGCNAHLVGMLLNSIVATLLPALLDGEKSADIKQAVMVETTIAHPLQTPQLGITADPMEKPHLETFKHEPAELTQPVEARGAKGPL